MERTTLCYIEKDGKVLMLYRNKKDVDMPEAISEMKKSQLLDEYKLYMVKKQIEVNANNQKRLFTGML